MSDERRHILDAAMTLDEHLQRKPPRSNGSAQNDPCVPEDATKVPNIRKMAARRSKRPTE